LTTTYETRQEANALLVQAEKALDEGNNDSSAAMIGAAHSYLALADRVD